MVQKRRRGTESPGNLDHHPRLMEQPQIPKTLPPLTLRTHLMTHKKKAKKEVTTSIAATTVEPMEVTSEEEGLPETQGKTLDKEKTEIETTVKQEGPTQVLLKDTSGTGILSLIDMSQEVKVVDSIVTTLLQDSVAKGGLMVTDLTDDHILHKTMIHTLVNLLETTSIVMTIEIDPDSSEDMTIFQETSMTTTNGTTTTVALEADLKDLVLEETGDTEDPGILVEHHTLQELLEDLEWEVSAEDLQEEVMVLDLLEMTDHQEENTLQDSMTDTFLPTALSGNLSSPVFCEFNQ